jgi:hypothetical protein
MDNAPRTPQTAIYEIRFHGQLDTQRSHWFEGLAMTPLPDGDTLLSGPLPDQSALYGILGRIQDLGLELLSVQRK